MKRLIIAVFIFLCLIVPYVAQVNYNPPVRKNVIAQDVNKVRNVYAYTGNASARIAAAITDLPATGGTVDATGLEGAQTINADIFNNVTKPIVVKLGAGTYTVSTTQTIETNKISLVGLGPFVTNVSCTANADCFRFTTNPWTTDQSGVFGGMTITGNSGTNAVGLHISGIVGLALRDLVVKDFDGTNGTGIWLDHGASFADLTANFVERLHMTGVHLDWNTVGLRMTAQAAATSAGFAFMHVLDTRFNVEAGQTGILTDGTNNGSMIQTDFQASINCINGGTMIRLMNNAIWYDSNIYRIVGETTSGAACIGADVDAGSFLLGVGVLDIVNGSTTAAIDGTLTIRSARNQPGSGYGKNFIEQTETFAVRSAIGSGGYGTYIHPDLGASGGFRQGVGQNVFFDGTNFIALGNGSTNSGAGLMFDATNYCFYVSPTTGGSNNTISSANWTTYQRLCITEGGIRFGSVASAGTPILWHGSATAAVAFGNAVANSCTADFAFTLNGALDTDSYTVNVVGAPAPAGVIVTVSGDIASGPAVRACNVLASMVTVGTLTLRVDAWRH